jgi:hypothetical protein
MPALRSRARHDVHHRLAGRVCRPCAGPTAADYAVYPFCRQLFRFERTKPDIGTSALVGPRTAAWMKRIEALPCHDRTYPPHWK